MNKTEMQTWREQVEAMLDTEVKSYKMNLGELADIPIGRIAGQGRDFLVRHGVPVVDIKFGTRIILTLELPGADPITEELPIKEGILLEHNRELLKAFVQEFIARHGEKPKQTFDHGITYVIDETQLDRS